MKNQTHGSTRMKAVDFKVAQAVLKALGPEGDRVLGLILKSDWDSVLSPPSVPQLLEGRDLDSFREAYQAWSFLTKDASLPSGRDLRKVAFDSFDAAEQRCRDTNHRLVHSAEPSILEGVREQVHQIVGSLRKPDYDFILESCRWGPGVTSSCKGQTTSEWDKTYSTLQATPALAGSVLSVMLRHDPVWSAAVLGSESLICTLKPPVQLITWNSLACVPKNAKTHRMIAVEPHCNARLQLGIGALLRSRLRSNGVNLNTQRLNQELAREGSLHDDLATIDLKAASDTVCYEVVRRLLPPDWFRLLDVARSPHYLDPRSNTVKPYAKFSSMGNGATFELESLIFVACVRLAIAWSNCTDTRHAVFGDDIVLPSKAVKNLLTILDELGFQVNVDKSFFSGPFRESCGADFYKGVDVRPFFKRESAEPLHVRYVLLNAIRSRCNTDGMVDDRLFSAWREILHTLPPSARLRVPSIAGETAGIWSTLDEAVTQRSVVWDRHLQTWKYKVHRFKSRQRKLLSCDEHGVPTHPGIAVDCVLLSMILRRTAGSWGGHPFRVTPERHETARWEGLPLRECGKWVQSKTVSAWDTSVHGWFTDRVLRV